MNQKRRRLGAALWLIGAALIGAAATVTILLWNGRAAPEPFYGEHQAGISTSAQKFGIVTAFDVTAKNADDLKTLLQTWTNSAAALTQGLPLAPPGGPKSAPAVDTGETLGYQPARLTITVGAGPSLFDDRYGLAGKKPAALLPLPVFKGDQLNPDWSGGDLVVQVCADDYETAYHAIHVLTRAAKGFAVPRWVQSGFQPGLEVVSHPARNLEGFIDGTVNPDAGHPETMDNTVWLGSGSGWMEGGSYLVVRRIRMYVETWDRASLGDQENTIGRDKHTGKELAQQDPDSHVKLAHGDGSQKLLRRPFHYVNGLDAKTGQWDSGLLFLAWMKDPETQFVPIQTRLSQSDLLNEYIKPVGSAVFAVFPGVSVGGYLGSGLFEVPLGQRIETLQGELGALYPALASGDWASMRLGADAWNKLWQDARAAAGGQAKTIDTLATAWISSLAGSDAVVTRVAQTALVKGLEEWKKTAVPKKAVSITDLAGLKTILATMDKALAAGNVEASKAAFIDFQKEWLAREALVRGMDTNAYAFIETQAGGIRRAIIADKPAWDDARTIAKGISGKLDGLQAPHAFGAWDAGFLLFREGLEALLVLAALLAFLGRTKQTQWTPWIWSGAGLGLAGSIGVAIAISVLMSGFMAATAPTLVEGITGLAAVVLMLAVGGWLHSKSSVKNWNTWLKDKLGTWGNSPWALALLALLSVLREGAETVLFFWGLAGSLSPVDMMIGVAGALVVLTVLGILMIGFSKRMPLNWFFPIATLLIYFLAVKILGQSVGSLQSAGVLSSTPLGFGSPIDAIGFIPTWEAAAPQLVLAAVLVTLVVRSILKAQKKPAPPAPKPAEAPNQ